MHKVLVSDKLADIGLKILKSTEIQVDVETGLSEDALAEKIGDYDALIIRSGTTVTEKIINAAHKLRVIGRAGIGVDNVDLPAASKKGIIVMNTPTGNAVTTAEHAIAMMFAVSRHIPQAMASVKRGEWERKAFTGHQLAGKVLGVVGCGNIGKIVANRALGLHMDVVGYDPFLSAESAEKLGIEPVSLEDLYKRSDLITLHTPLTDKTRGMINRQAFEQMKKGVIVVNCARGGIVVESDLIWAIDEGIVAGAALDVYEEEPLGKDHPLLKYPQIVMTPHLGAATDEAQLNVAKEIAELVVDYLQNGVIKNAVNVPSVSAESLKVLGPFLELSEKLGSLHGQLAESLPETVHIEYYGDIADYEIQPLTISVLKGLLSPMLEGVNVNYVNATIMAQDCGIKIVESKISDHSDYASLISVEAKGKTETRKISGTIFGHTALRIVQINDFYLEAIPEGHLLYIHNEDKPGVIGAIGTLLGENGINISRMQLGLKPGSREAVAVYSVDKRLKKDLFDKLSSLPHILSAKQLEL